MRWRSRLQGKQRSARRRQDERTHAWKSPKVWTAFMVQTTLAEPGGKSWPKHISIGPQEADGKVRPARLIIQGKQAPKTVEFNQRKSRLICISLCTSLGRPLVRVRWSLDFRKVWRGVEAMHRPRYATLAARPLKPFKLIQHVF